MNNNIFEIIPEGKYKGKRLYDENKFGGLDILKSEMLQLYLFAIKNNYKIFCFNCLPNHNIEIEVEQLNFIKKSLE